MDKKDKKQKDTKDENVLNNVIFRDVEAGAEFLLPHLIPFLLFHTDLLKMQFYNCF